MKGSEAEAPLFGKDPLRACHQAAHDAARGVAAGQEQMPDLMGHDRPQDERLRDLAVSGDPPDAIGIDVDDPAGRPLLQRYGAAARDVGARIPGSRLAVRDPDRETSFGPVGPAQSSVAGSRAGSQFRHANITPERA